MCGSLDARQASCFPRSRGDPGSTVDILTVYTEIHAPNVRQDGVFAIYTTCSGRPRRDATRRPSSVVSRACLAGAPREGSSGRRLGAVTSSVSRAWWRRCRRRCRCALLLRRWLKVGRAVEESRCGARRRESFVGWAALMVRLFRRRR
jgi:hypothetical protein